MRRHTFYVAIGVLAALFLALRFVVKPPIPVSVLTMYMVLSAAAMLVFVAANEERFDAFKAPILAMLEGRAPRLLQVLALVAIPLVVGWVTWLRVAPSTDAPFEPRVVHPQPPTSITVSGKRVEIAGLQNPLRANAADLEKNTEAGKTLYYQNCFYCHGDALAGDGHFARAFSPLPANFRDVGTISMLQESYVFWRIATGAQGLPKGATPWNSAMPFWQNFLTEEQIWQVILYIYAGSGSTPRTWDEDVKHDKH